MAILYRDLGCRRPENPRAAVDFLQNLEQTAGANRANPRAVADARETLRTAPLGALLADPAFASEAEYLGALARRVASGAYGPPPTATVGR